MSKQAEQPGGEQSAASEPGADQERLEAAAFEEARRLPKPEKPKPPRRKPTLAQIVDAYQRLCAARDKAVQDRDLAGQELDQAVAQREGAARTQAEVNVKQQELVQAEQEIARERIQLEQQAAAQFDGLQEVRVELRSLRKEAEELGQQRIAQFEAAAAEERAARERHARRQAKLDREADERRRALEAQADTDVREIVNTARAETDQLREQAREAAREREQELATAQKDIDAREIDLVEKERRLERERRQLERRLAHRQREAEEAVRDRIEELEQRAQREAEDRAAERNRREAAEAQLETLDAAGGRGATDLVRELEDLRRKLHEARRELESRPPAALRDEHEQVKLQLTTLREELTTLNRDKLEWVHRERERELLKGQVLEYEQAVAEQQERHKLLEHRIVGLRQDLELLTDASDAEPPDADLVAIDQASRERVLQEDGRPDEYRPSLAELITDMQDRLARAGFFYEDLDLRLFVAGLAGARIQILDGISGTGKTSLPRMFAEVTGTDCDIIEVQAAWRDRLDLLGTYNAFDRRLYPTEFSRALYRANCPGWRDRITLIVLDEMNLAQPEHYFADVLSALENGKERLQLLPRPIGTAEHLVGGQSVCIGPNVWFIGTANLDETTATIADKTYDRANLLELPPRHPHREAPGDPLDTLHLSHRHLAGLFDDAQKTEHGVAHVAAVIDNDDLRDASRRLRIDFGNRIDRIIKRFVPVLIATGGTEQQALDHVLATKLVRKLGYRYEITQKPFDDFRETLELVAGDLEHLPKTVAALERERERFGLS